MKFRAFQFCLVTLVCLGGISQAPAQQDTDTIRRWVADLDSEVFKTREAATKQLQRAGRQAFAPLAEAAAGASLEVTLRALAILDEGARSRDAMVARAAKKSLRTLLASKNVAAAHRARVILARDLEQIALLLEHAGVTVLRTNGVISGIKLGDLADASLDLARVPDAEAFTLSHPLFGDVHALLLKHLAKVDSLNLFETDLTDEGLKLFKHFPNLKRVPMGYTKVTNAGLVHLQTYKNLDYVGLRGNPITDAGLPRLAGLTNLTGLNLAETKVTDAGLANLKALTRLESLYLYGTAVTDQGLKHLHGLTRLKFLDVTGTKVTEQGIASLRAKVKEVRVKSGKGDE